MVSHVPENAGSPPSMHHLVWLSVDTLEQAPGGQTLQRYSVVLGQVPTYPAWGVGAKPTLRPQTLTL